MARQFAILDSTAPWRVRDAVAAAEAQGYSIAPPWPSDDGIANFNGEGPFTPPHWAYERDFALRTAPGPGRWWAFWLAVSSVVVPAALLGWWMR